jgi:hypothetical protein
MSTVSAVLPAADSPSQVVPCALSPDEHTDLYQFVPMASQFALLNELMNLKGAQVYHCKIAQLIMRTGLPLEDFFLSELCGHWFSDT